MFPGPRAPEGEPASLPEWFEHDTRGIAELYPVRIGAWFLAEGRFGDHWLEGRDVIALGARPCAALTDGARGVMASTSR